MIGNIWDLIVTMGYPDDTQRRLEEVGLTDAEGRFGEGPLLPRYPSVPPLIELEGDTLRWLIVNDQEPSKRMAEADPKIINPPRLANSVQPE